MSDDIAAQLAEAQAEIERLRARAEEWQHEASLTQLNLLLRAEAAEAKLAEQEWRPIETAPKDKTRIQLARLIDTTRFTNLPRLGWVKVGKFTAHWKDGYREAWHEDSVPETPINANSIPIGPTHWRPLPPPPSPQPQPEQEVVPHTVRTDRNMDDAIDALRHNATPPATSSAGGKRAEAWEAMVSALDRAVTYVELTYSEEAGEEAAEAKHDLDRCRAAQRLAEEADGD